jgi:hypothetical protein
MEMRLNIYDDAGNVTKTYISQDYDLRFGVMEDILNAIDFDNLGDDKATRRTILKLLPVLKPFLKQVFVGLTDEEIRNTKGKELVPTFYALLTYAFKEMGALETKKTGN